ncbi:MAG: LemA family protein [Salinivirgaceae bacterium]|jgi:LemA protein|nr:LemA family protein [Bacteroidales bacterium]
MRKKTVWIIVIVLIALIAISPVISYNAMTKKEEAVTTQWSNVKNVYQRRLDLIPNLVNTVKGYADFEKETLTGVVEARSKATQTTIDPTNLSERNIEQFQSVQNELSGALSRLMITVERYPELKASQNFLELQAQLEGTENRIAVERRKFNEAAQDFNSYIRRFPKNIWANLFGFERKAYFEADTGAEKAPTVEF